MSKDELVLLGIAVFVFLFAILDKADIVNFSRI